jgi:expansin (peptidoglycan-binding protein)
MKGPKTPKQNGIADDTTDIQDKVLIDALPQLPKVIEGVHVGDIPNKFMKL